MNINLAALSPSEHAGEAISPLQAEALLADLAAVFLNNSGRRSVPTDPLPVETLPDINAMYRALLEQVPAVVFMAYMDRGIGEAYVSPQIEKALGFSQEEWLEDPVRWYHQIHPDDKQRWSVEAAEMFLSGKPLRSAYRVMARDGRVIWFQCDAKMIRREDGRPWFIHGVGFDITELKRTEEALQKERNLVSAILDTVRALVVVLDSDGRVVRLNRACEEITGYSFHQVKGRLFWELILLPEEAERFHVDFERIRRGLTHEKHESPWITQSGARRVIEWSNTILPGDDGKPAYVIATGTDITERKRLEAAILDISAREQRRIGQDLHDGLGQHLTGIAFMSKVQEQRLAEKQLPEAADASKIVALVNEAIHKTRELARGLLPVVSDAHGLMSALSRWACEVEDVFRVSCRFQAEKPVLIDDVNVSAHLYRIAQESVHNSIKHGQAKNIVIGFGATGGRGKLQIDDDGVGIADALGQSSGMGLQIMGYRARMIGGSLSVSRKSRGGTIVTCDFPLQKSGLD